MDFEKRIRETNEGNHYMLHNHIRLLRMEEDCAEVELLVHPESRNLYGGLHGGLLYTMADCAAGGAARSRGMRYVTLSSSFEFHRTTKEEVLRAVATVRHRGQSICSISVEVKDCKGKLLASGSYTMFYTGKLDE